MKLHFEPNLDYQRDAINAVCDLFNKWERCTSVFTVSKFFGALPGFDNTNGYGN
jgi:type III restriction enzyme